MTERFKVNLTLPPFEEVKFLRQIEKALKGLLLPDLIDIVKEYYVPFAFALTPLQREYDIETDTLPENKRTELGETVAFLQRDGDELLRYYYNTGHLLMIPDFDQPAAIRVPHHVQQIATDNLRFKCEQWKQKNNVVSIHGPITKPTFTDVSCFIKVQQMDATWMAASPYLVSTLLSIHQFGNEKWDLLFDLLSFAIDPDFYVAQETIDDIDVELDVAKPTSWDSNKQVLDIVKVAFPNALTEPRSIDLAMRLSRAAGHFDDIDTLHSSKFEELYIGFCDMLDFTLCDSLTITKVNWNNNCYHYWFNKVQEALHQNALHHYTQSTIHS